MKKIKKLIALSLVLVMSVGLFACNNDKKTEEPAKQEETAKDTDKKAEGELYISAAASLKESMEEIGEDFTKETGIKVNNNFGSSGALQKQIEEGAQADVFVSAGKKQIKALEEKDLLENDSIKDLLQNEVVIIVPEAKKGEIKTLDDVVEKAEKIAVAQTDSVPVGQYTKESLDNLKLWDKIEDRVVLAKNVREVLAWVEQGNADAGFVYRTDAMVAKDSVVIGELDPTSYKEVIYPAAIVKDTKNKDASQKYLDFLNSDTAKKVFEKNGFKVK